ncbi:MAG: hypothetical protein VYB72_04600 [Planctomycetota bacterium]|nr:hypothetical protein [Planctomycetota bacterium]
MSQRAIFLSFLRINSVILLLHLCITAPMLLGNERPIQTNDPVGTKNSEQEAENSEKEDRVWLLSTRQLVSRASQVNLEEPQFSVSLQTGENRFQPVAVKDFLDALHERKKAVVYVHGNRFTASDAIERGLLVYENVAKHSIQQPLDWIIWSWQSDKSGILAHDARLKALRTEGQGLYLAWLLRQHTSRKISTTLVGYSFGGRVVTGALHALAGGALGGVSMGDKIIQGAPINTGLIAPAIDSLWLDDRGYHRLATQNMNRLTLLYNRRDAILKRYWLIDRVQGRLALGYTGPRSFAPRADGSTLPVISRDCSNAIGVKHDELYYFQKSCNAGREIAKLINEQPTFE